MFAPRQPRFESDGVAYIALPASNLKQMQLTLSLVSAVAGTVGEQDGDISTVTKGINIGGKSYPSVAIREAFYNRLVAAERQKGD